MKFAIFALLFASVFAAEGATEAEIAEATDDELDEAIKNFKEGIKAENMATAELAAYEACIATKTLPEETKKAAYLVAVYECYNVIGKEGWRCQGNRRDCESTLCCGKVSKGTTLERYSC